MALFTNTSELDRQGVYSAPSKVDGPKKAMLAALGYKDTGESNQWGKVLNVLPGVGAIGRNAAAGGLSKGTDANSVVKGQRAEAFNDSMAGLQLGFEVAKLAAGIGNAGGVGQFFGLGNKASAQPTPGADMVQGLQNTALQQKTEEDLSNDLKNVQFDEEGNQLPPGQDYISQPGQPNGLGSTLGGQNNFLNGVQKVDNVLGKLPMVGGVAKAIGNNLTSGLALNAAGTNAYNDLKSKSTYQAAFNYL